MKNILFKVRFHPLFYLLLVLSILTAQFQKVVEFMTIIFAHELGHVSVATFFGWNIKRILILPFGGMVEFQEKLNRPMYQEFLITLGGPLFQILLSFFWKSSYHLPLLFFNLLPIYPLDGSKFLFLLLNFFTSYYHSYLLLFFCSSFTIFFLLLRDPNFFALLFFSYLLYQNVRMLGSVPELFLRFLFERYQENFFFYRKKKIMGVHFKKMKRDVRHFFMIEGKLYEEQEALGTFFFQTLKK